MNWLDIVIIVGLVISFVTGIQQGLIRILFTLAGGIIGVLLAGRYSDALAEKLTFISDYGIAGTVAFVIIIVATIIVAMILGMIVKKIIHALPIVGWVDKLAGGVIGLLTGAIFIGALIAMWMKYGTGGADVILGSSLARFLLDKFQIVLGLLPSDYQIIHNFFNL